MFLHLCVHAPEGFSTTGLLHWNLGGLWPFPRFPSWFHCSGIVEDHLAKTKKGLLAFPTSSLLSSPPAWCLSLPCLSHTCDSSQPACPQTPCTFLGPLLLWPPEDWRVSCDEGKPAFTCPVSVPCTCLQEAWCLGIQLSAGALWRIMRWTLLATEMGGKIPNKHMYLICLRQCKSFTNITSFNSCNSHFTYGKTETQKSRNLPKVTWPVSSRTGIWIQAVWTLNHHTVISKKERIWDCCYCCLVAQSCLILRVLWIVVLQAPLSMGFPRQEYWSGLPSPGESSHPRGWSCISFVSCISRWILYHWATWEVLLGLGKVLSWVTFEHALNYIWRFFSGSDLHFIIIINFNVCPSGLLKDILFFFFPRWCLETRPCA